MTQHDQPHGSDGERYRFDPDGEEQRRLRQEGEDVHADGEASYRDALPTGPGHRRGAGLNPGNRFEKHRVHVLGEHLDRVATGAEELDPPVGGEAGPWHGPSSGGACGGSSGGGGVVGAEPHRDSAGKVVPLTVFKDHTQRIINAVDPKSDMRFRWTVNPYRGCEHGCIYCYARPYHEYLGFSCGLDFETKIVAKPEAAALLRKELARPSWKAEPVVMSAITDVYQPLEKEMRLTRQCMEVLAETTQPVTIMTKNALVLRDLDLLTQLSASNAARVIVTLPTLDAALAEKLEPRASAPAGRLRAMRELSKAGVPVTVMVAPVIPGLTDREMPKVLEQASANGATGAIWVLLRLPWQIKALFLDWLQHELPGQAGKVESLLRQARGGKLYRADFPERRRGRGAQAQQIAKQFDVFTRKYGLNRNLSPLNSRAFRRPDDATQMGLFR